MDHTKSLLKGFIQHLSLQDLSDPALKQKKDAYMKAQSFAVKPIKVLGRP